MLSFTTCLKLCPADPPLSRHLQRNPGREVWSQRPLVFSIQPSSPARYNRHSSTPLHNSKILPFTSIDYTPCSVAWFSLLFFCSVSTRHLSFAVPCGTWLSHYSEVLPVSRECNLLCSCQTQLMNKMTGRQKCYLQDCTSMLFYCWAMKLFSLLRWSCNKICFWSQCYFNVNAKSALLAAASQSNLSIVPYMRLSFPLKFFFKYYIISTHLNFNKFKRLCGWLLCLHPRDHPK